MVRKGPVFGILVSGPKGTLPTVKTCRFYGDVLHAAQKSGVLCYLFGPSDVDAQTKTVLGYVDGSGSSWEKRKFPLPEVVYNRIPDRTSEVQVPVNILKRFFLETGIPMFNPGFLNKGTTYQYLLDDDKTRSYVPQSATLQNANVLQVMVDRHSVVYCKPTGGSLGIGMLRIQSTKDGLELRYRVNKEDFMRTFDSPQSLYRYIRRAHPVRHYIVQQGIDLLAYKGAPTDFRTHLHKDSSGVWDVVGVGAKVAGAGAITTHVHSGGYVADAREVLQSWRDKGSSSLYASLEKASIEVAEAIDNRMHGYVGELGMDFGIDCNDRVWLFEANSKPGRTIFKHPSLRGEARQLVQHILGYGAYIARAPKRGS